jgi:hypothetical protein
MERSFDPGKEMAMKKLSPKKIALHRETLLVLESEPLREVRGDGALPPTKICGPKQSGSSICTFAC